MILQYHRSSIAQVRGCGPEPCHAGMPAQRQRAVVDITWEASLVLQLDTARLKTKNACYECCCPAETLRGRGYVEAALARNDWVAGYRQHGVATQVTLQRPINSDGRGLLPS